MALGLRLGLSLGSTRNGGGGSPSPPTIPQRLIDAAAFILDFSRGGTTAYTTAGGSTPSADTGFVRSIGCEKAPAGVGTRIVRDADEFTWRNNPTDNILGSGVVRYVAGIGAVMSGDTGNANPSDLFAVNKWWLLFHGRLGGTGGGLTIEFFRSDTNNAQVQLFYRPDTGVLRLSVNGANYDNVIVNGAVVRFAAYYDGTDLHVWVNAGARQDHAGVGGLGSLDAGPRYLRGRPDATEVAECSALWIGKLDGGNAAQHMADIATWLTVKGSA